MKYELLEPAERDVRSILVTTRTLFGPLQVRIYAELIQKAVSMVAEQPERASSIARPDIRPGIRIFLVSAASGRRGSAAHCLYYTTGTLSNGKRGVLILRVLHEHMESRRRVLKSLSSSRPAN